MATIVADESVQSIASNAMASVATTAILSAPGVAALPIVGVIGTVFTKLPRLGNGPTITLVYALEGRQSATVISTDRPKFELFFGDLVGANPDDFEPVILKINPTNNNWRLAGAQKINQKYLESHERTEAKFIEDIIPTHLNNFGRGHVGIEPQDPLPPGEYGVAIRPKSKTLKLLHQNDNVPLRAK